MGKSLDLALPDFEKRYLQESNFQNKHLKFRKESSLLFLKRNILKRQIKLGKKTRQIHLNCKFNPSSTINQQSPLKFVCACLVLKEYGDHAPEQVAYIERKINYEIDNDSIQLKFKTDVHLISEYVTCQYKSATIEFWFLPEKTARDFSKLVNQNVLENFRLTNLLRLRAGERSEWKKRDQPPHIANTMKGWQKGEIILAPSNIYDDHKEIHVLSSFQKKQDIFHVEFETITKPRISSKSRKFYLSSTTGSLLYPSFSQILKSNPELDLLAPEAEFRFPFGPSSYVRRVQRCKGKCIFCECKITSSSELVCHLAFDHVFHRFKFDFSLEHALLVITITHKSMPIMEKDGQTLPPPRKYVHSSTYEALYPYEVDENSEDELDETWLYERSEFLLDEFEDVSDNERKIMKYWNRHVRFYNSAIISISDFSVPELCESFVKNNVKILAPLRRELLIHFFNLWESGLVTQSILENSLKWFDQKVGE